MIVLLAVVLYVAFVLGGIQFFRQVHRWDEQASRMWNDELLRLESERTQQLKGRRNTSRESGRGVSTKITPTTVSLQS
jgi:hypothetical protein